MLFNFEGPRSSKGGVPRSPAKSGGVAQMGEHLPCKQGVRSSILLISTIFFPREGERDGLWAKRGKRNPHQMGS